MNEHQDTSVEGSSQEPVNESRRAFLNVYGKAALIAPPVITALLATSMSSPAIAASTGGSTTSKGGGGNGAPLGLLLGAAPVGLAAAAPRAQVLAPVRQSQALPAAVPAAEEIEVPPAPPPSMPGPERG